MLKKGVSLEKKCCAENSVVGAKEIAPECRPAPSPKTNTKFALKTVSQLLFFDNTRKKGGEPLPPSQPLITHPYHVK